MKDFTTGAAALAAMSLAVSSSNTRAPAEILSPTLILSSVTVPPKGAGMSMAALSDSTVMMESSAARASPGFTMISMTSTSLKLPISGTRTSLMLIFSSPYTFTGLARLASMPYFLMASAALPAGITPSSARALRAARTT